MRLSTCLVSLWDLFRDDSSSNRHLWLFWWFDVILRMQALQEHEKSWEKDLPPLANNQVNLPISPYLYDLKVWKSPTEMVKKGENPSKTLQILGSQRRTDGIFRQELPRYRLGDTTDKCKSETPVSVQHVQQTTQEWWTNLVSTGQTGICWNEISPPSSDIFLIDAHLSAALSRLKTLKSKYSPRMLVAWCLLMLLDLRLEEHLPKHKPWHVATEEFRIVSSLPDSLHAAWSWRASQLKDILHL